jgi:hypothetical protein
VVVFRLGVLLSRAPRFEGEEQALVDVWLAHVLPRVAAHCRQDELDEGVVPRTQLMHAAKLMPDAVHIFAAASG